MISFAFHETFHLEKGHHEEAGPAILAEMATGLRSTEESCWLGAQAVGWGLRHDLGWAVAKGSYPPSMSPSQPFNLIIFTKKWADLQGLSLDSLQPSPCPD